MGSPASSAPVAIRPTARSRSVNHSGWLTEVGQAVVVTSAATACPAGRSVLGGHQLQGGLRCRLEGSDEEQTLAAISTDPMSLR